MQCLHAFEPDVLARCLALLACEDDGDEHGVDVLLGELPDRPAMDAHLRVLLALLQNETVVASGSPARERRQTFAAFLLAHAVNTSGR